MMLPMSDQDPVAVVIIGGGPGGLAPLFAAAAYHKLQDLLQSGVVILEQSGVVGSGDIGNQAIRSDSAAEAFLDIAIEHHPALSALRNHPSFLAVKAYVGKPVPLPLVSEFLRCAGQTMAAIVARSPRGRSYCQATALSTRQLSANRWNTCFVNQKTGATEEVLSTSVILATGAHQPDVRLYVEKVAGEPLLPRYKEKLVSSGFVLTPAGLETVAAKLAARSFPKVVIIGGSASAGSVAQVLLHRFPGGLLFGENGVTLMHRRPIRIFYGSVSEAKADGYTEWSAEDVCPLTGRLHRLGGLRFDSRDVIMSARGIGNRVRDPRIRLQPLTENTFDESRSILEEADLIVAALGYVPRALPVFGPGNEQINLRTQDGTSKALVDTHCRVLDAEGKIMSGLFAIGLATGRPPTSDIGGESGFMGQVNSLWLWQHMTGLQIVDQVLERASTKQDNRYTYRS